MLLAPIITVGKWDMNMKAFKLNMVPGSNCCIFQCEVLLKGCTAIQKRIGLHSAKMITTRIEKGWKKKKIQSIISSIFGSSDEINLVKAVHVGVLIWCGGQGSDSEVSVCACLAFTVAIHWRFFFILMK